MKAVPGEEYFDTENPRADITNPLDTAERGYKLFNHVYRDEAAGALEPYKHTPSLSIHYQWAFLILIRSSCAHHGVWILSCGF